MIKIITKKEYEDLHEIIDIQNKQIDELIVMVREANARTTYAIKYLCDLVDFIDIRCGDLPPEVRKLMDEIKNLNKD